jgi:hypothetical protein
MNDEKRPMRRIMFKPNEEAFEAEGRGPTREAFLSTGRDKRKKMTTDTGTTLNQMILPKGTGRVGIPHSIYMPASSRRWYW